MTNYNKISINFSGCFFFLNSFQVHELYKIYLYIYYLVCLLFAFYVMDGWMAGWLVGWMDPDKMMRFLYWGVRDLMTFGSYH